MLALFLPDPKQFLLHHFHLNLIVHLLDSRHDRLRMHHHFHLDLNLNLYYLLFRRNLLYHQFLELHYRLRNRYHLSRLYLDHRSLRLHRRHRRLRIVLLRRRLRRLRLSQPSRCKHQHLV